MTDKQITLGDRSYTIPPLAIRQNRHVEVLAARNRDYVARLAKPGENLLAMTDAEAEDVTRIVYHALTRALPTLTFDQFEGLNASMRDVVRALPVCLLQSGLFAERPAAESAPRPGEPTSSTGTPSSPSSATG